MGSLDLILAEMLFTLPTEDEMLPLSALFAGKYQEVLVQVGLCLPRQRSANRQ
jgi:hypothetical protein